MALHLKSTGIDFTDFNDNAGMATELLDDYEEGTFTATWTTDSVAPSSPPTHTCHYTKIGRQVFCFIDFLNVNLSGGSGGHKITGLPFTGRTDEEATSSTLFFLGLGINADKVQTMRLSGSSTELQGYESSAGSWVTWGTTAAASKYIKFTLTYNAT
jgi:hypothetical protein